jgi:hypothetical protein
MQQIELLYDTPSSRNITYILLLLDGEGKFSQPVLLNSIRPPLPTSTWLLDTYFSSHLAEGTPLQVPDVFLLLLLITGLTR